MPEAHPHHEASDVDFTAIGVGAGVIAAGIALAVGLPWIVIGTTHLAVTAPNNARLPTLRAPRQLTASASDLEKLRREKLQRLESAGFDAASGAGHIPIERAMQLLAAQAAKGGR